MLRMVGIPSCYGNSLENSEQPEGRYRSAPRGQDKFASNRSSRFGHVFEVTPTAKTFSTTLRVAPVQWVARMRTKRFS